MRSDYKLIQPLICVINIQICTYNNDLLNKFNTKKELLFPVLEVYTPFLKLATRRH
jgi:hypothetical protein